MEGNPYLIASDGLLARKSGEWAKRKHHYLGRYCGITTGSMAKKFKLVYVDVMAGPGLCRIEETREEFPGSPFVALEHDFADYILIEDDPDLVRALKARVAKHPKAHKVKVIENNWIEVMEAGQLKFDASTLVVAFVDPTGVSQIPLAAIKKLAANPRIDLLVTIQYRLGIVWNARQYQRSKNTDTALDNFLGVGNWRKWSYKDATEFGRKAVNSFCNELEKEGFKNPPHISVPEENPLYRFTYFSRHPVGEEFWNKITKLDEKGQRELQL
jgi:three-Cys-motif partner protein